MRFALTALLVSTVASGAARAPNALDGAVEQVKDAVAGQRLETPLGLYLEGGAPELTRGFATLLASRLALAKIPTIVIAAQNAGAAEAEARKSGARSLLRARVELEHGLLRVRGDGFTLWRNFWAGKTATRTRGSAFTLDVSVTADAHALALAAAVPPPGPLATEAPLSMSKLLPVPSPLAALATGDLNGDRRDEVVALTDQEVIALDGRGNVLARHSLSHLPLSPMPTRDPFGWISVLGGVVEVRSANRDVAERLTLTPEGLVAAAARPEVPRFAPGRSELEPVGDGPGRWSESVRGNETLTVFSNRTATWRTPDPVQLAEVATGTSLVDLEGDGVAELATSSPDVQPVVEFVAIHARAGRAPPGPLTVASLEKKYDQPLEEGARVLHLAAGNLDGVGGDELVVGVWLADGTSELRVVRRGP